MSSERRKGFRKLSRGILKSRTHDIEDQRNCRGVKIYVNSNENDESVPSGADEEEFEKLKDVYYKQCQPINMNLLRRLSNKHSQGFTIDEHKCTRLGPQQTASTMIFDNDTHKPSRSGHHEARHKPTSSHCISHNHKKKNRSDKDDHNKKKERIGCLECHCRHC